MNPDSGLILPALVPATNELILSPQAKIDRQAMLDAIEAEEAEHEDNPELLRPETELRDRVKLGVCHRCSKRKLLFKPALVCSHCLERLAAEHGLALPEPAAGRPMNRAERRKAAHG